MDEVTERGLLLSRLYGYEELFSIGKELGIEFFMKLSNPYQITDRHKASLEISTNINVDKLFDIVRRHPPVPYFLKELGGFQGRHYSADENGRVERSDSTESVKKAAELALQRYGQSAFGYLTSILSKGGEASFIEIVGETERLTTRNVWNPVLLRRLSVYPFRLVFKTGSNRYPTWTIPSEIVSVVKEVLSISSWNSPSKVTAA